MTARGEAVSVAAEREVAEWPAHVYAFLARLDNHWHLAPRQLCLHRLDNDRCGGMIVINGPLGLRRLAHTTVTTAHEPHRFGGHATVGARTRADVLWRIEPTRDGARVALECTILRPGVLDRVLLAIGGRWWLRRSFHAALKRLADTLEGPRATPFGAYC